MDDEQYRALVEHAPSLVWRTGVTGQHEYFNATWLAFTGRSTEQELGTGWVAGLHPDDVFACLAVQEDHLARREGFEIEYRLRRHDGLYRRVVDRGVPYTDSAGAFAGFVGNCVDIEERRARAESFGVNDFFEMSLDNLCVAGFDGYFKRLNPSWTTTLGWTAAELMSKPSQEFLHPDDVEQTLAGRKRLHEGAELGPLVNRYLCRDGSYRWFEWRSVAHEDRGLVYAAARDITEQRQAVERLSEAKRAQEELERRLLFADRMASLGTLAAGVAHEVNNPLTYVLGNVTLMIEMLNDSDGGWPAEGTADLIEQAADIREGAERIRKIVSGLKTFSRSDPDQHALVDVARLLEQSIAMTFNEIRHRGRLVRNFNEIPLVEADATQLGQVFINLLINAAQALPEGDTAGNEVRVTTSTDSVGRAVIEIHDTGAGIPADLLGRIFDPFFTTKPIGTGTGLGLAICHSIVAGLGGELTVTSEPGCGATFNVVLPAATLAPGKAAVTEEAAVRVHLSGAVLVVDDEPSVGLILGRILETHETTIVTSAQEALRLIGAGKHFDAIISDLMMPEMSGMEFYDELARHAPELTKRVVFISGGAFTPLARAFLESTANPFVQKPFDPDAMRSLVQQLLA